MNLRSEEEWSKVWEKAFALADKCDITVAPLRTRRNCKLPHHLSESSVVESSVGRSTDTPIEEYRTDVYYTTLDAIIHEMNARFSELNLSLMGGALDAFIPNSQLFLNLSTLKPFLSHYNICEAAVTAEISTVKTFLQEEAVESVTARGEEQLIKSFHSVYHSLLKIPECFLKCYQIAMTIHVSNASAERSFSSLRRLRTYLQSTMTQEHLTNLAVLYIERDLTSQLLDKHDDLVVSFAQNHNNGRIVLFYIRRDNVL